MMKKTVAMIEVPEVSLVPIGEKADTSLDYILDVFSKSGVSFQECLDHDARALCASEMRYFPKEYYGYVPSYAVFTRYLNKLGPDIKDSFNEVIAEVESGSTLGRMKDIARGGDYSRDSQVEFNMTAKINSAYERRLERIDKRRKDRGEGVERGVDLAAKLIASLSNSDLLQIKGKVDAIDAEYTENE